MSNFKKNIIYVVGIVICLAIIAGLFGVVYLRNHQDSVEAAQTEKKTAADNAGDDAEENTAAITIGRDAEEDEEEPEETPAEDEADAEEADADAEEATETDADDEATETDADAEDEEAAEEDTETAEEDTETAEDESLPAEIGDLSQSGAFYQKLADGESVNILIVGDSIGYGTGASDEDAAWFTLLAEDWEDTYGSDCEITNLALNGNTSYGAYVTVEQLGDDAGDYDLVIVCSGQNDEDSELGLYYEVLLRSLYRHFPDCTILSILESSQREVTGKISTITDLADNYGILTVDTITPFTEDYDALSDDGIHPNDEGQILYAQAIEQAVSDALTEGRAADNAGAEPVNSGVDAYDAARWYDAEDFSEYSGKDNVLSATISDSGVLGIVYGYGSSVASPTVYLDGTSYSVNPSVLADTEIVQVASDVSTDFELRVEFADAEQAGLFQGVLFSS